MKPSQSSRAFTCTHILTQVRNVLDFWVHSELVPCKFSCVGKALRFLGCQLLRCCCRFPPCCCCRCCCRYRHHRCRHCRRCRCCRCRHRRRRRGDDEGECLQRMPTWRWGGADQTARRINVIFVETTRVTSVRRGRWVGQWVFLIGCRRSVGVVELFRGKTTVEIILGSTGKAN